MCTVFTLILWSNFCGVKNFFPSTNLVLTSQWNKTYHLRILQRLQNDTISTNALFKQAYLSQQKLFIGRCLENRRQSQKHSATSFQMIERETNLHYNLNNIQRKKIQLKSENMFFYFFFILSLSCLDFENFQAAFNLFALSKVIEKLKIEVFYCKSNEWMHSDYPIAALTFCVFKIMLKYSCELALYTFKAPLKCLWE